MIRTIINQEQERLRAAGYQSELQTLTVGIDRSQKQIYLGNDIYVLSGIRLSTDDVLVDLNRVVLTCPTESLTATQQHISQLGTSIVKVFRHYINVSTFSDSTDNVFYGQWRQSYDVLLDERNYSYEVFYDFWKYRGFIRQSAVLSVNDFYGISHFNSYEEYFESGIGNLSNGVWSQYHNGYLKYGYRLIEPVVDMDRFDRQDLDELYEYMSFATGKRVERAISPYELEFVRIIPIRQ